MGSAMAKSAKSKGTAPMATPQTYELNGLARVIPHKEPVDGFKIVPKKSWGMSEAYAKLRGMK